MISGTRYIIAQMFILKYSIGMQLKSYQSSKYNLEKLFPSAEFEFFFIINENSKKKKRKMRGKN